MSLRQKHLEELGAFRERAKQRKKDARKEGGKTLVEQVEAQLAQEELDLAAKHRAELEDCDEEDEEVTVAPSNDDAIERKKLKAQRKRGRRTSKARDREAKIAQETKELEATSDRKAELDAINAGLSRQGLTIAEVAADGNCLYRAVEHQLVGAGQASPDATHAALRRRTADYMRRHQDDFIAFVAVEADDPVAAFEEHCAKVADTAEWGGQPELLALTRLLHRPIWVHSRGAPVLKMGEDILDAPPPLQLTFHRHYYALGEHYNSVKPLEPPADDD